MKSYKLQYLPTFIADLDEATDYICYNLNNPIAANDFIDAVEAAILERQPFAESFATYPSLKKREHPYYYIPVGNYLVMYVVIEDIMEIRRLVYGRRNIAEMM